MRSEMVTAPSPSAFAFLVSRETKLFTPCIWSSALSSIVMIRSALGMYWERALRKVVLPLLVPPEIKML